MNPNPCTHPNCQGMPPMPDPTNHKIMRGHPIMKGVVNVETAQERLRRAIFGADE